MNLCSECRRFHGDRNGFQATVTGSNQNRCAAGPLIHNAILCSARVIRIDKLNRGNRRVRAGHGDLRSGLVGLYETPDAPDKEAVSSAAPLAIAVRITRYCDQSATLSNCVLTAT